MISFLVILFLLQLISFYFLALLYTKVSKFDDFEKKQRKIMNEMDDSLGAYLAELKDENERLIQRLAERDSDLSAVERGNGVVAARKSGEGADKEHPKVRVNTPKIPINLALKSYNAVTAATETAFAQATESEMVDDRTRAIQMHNSGVSVEEIAKKLGKGRTEVELILKFK